ncbi:hypothetical protein [Streptomyces sp. NPDC005485]|uniref:hypothetical protein n=1 Tax=Streptomyces sp. NPDC005485 TaxID=3155591 RepID=UPI0033ACF275
MGPPPPVYAPGPTRQSPFGAFLGRTFRGDWAGAVQAALWPVGLLLIASVALGIPSYGQSSDGGEAIIGFGDRTRVALAVLLQALGGGFEVKSAPASVFGGGGGDGGLAGDFEGGGSLSLVPLTVTALWIAALFIGARMLRTRMLRLEALRAAALGAGMPGTTGVPVAGMPFAAAPVAGMPRTQFAQPGPYGGGPQSTTAGLEAAARVALLVTAGVLGLGLVARPTLLGVVQVSSSPLLAGLGALLLGFAVAAGVLHGDDLARWSAARPGTRALLRATGTALRALSVVLLLCSVVAFICLTQIDGLDDLWDTDSISPLAAALLVLPNLAVTALGLSWGTPIVGEARGTSSYSYGGGYDHESFGLSELADVTNSWAIVGALALGLVCALTVGVMAARRSADRREQLLAAGVFYGLFLLLAGFGGLGWELSGSSSDDSGYGSGYSSGGSRSGSVSIGLDFPYALLFGLLWIFIAAFVAPYLLRIAGLGAGSMGSGMGPEMGAGMGAGMGSGMASVPGLGAPVPSETSMPSATAMPSVTPLPPATPATPVTPPPAPPLPGSPTPGPVPPQAFASPLPTPVSVPVPPPAPFPGPVAAPTPMPYDFHTVHLGQRPPVTPKPRSRSLVWVVTLAVAFVVGGGAAAGVLVWQDQRSDGSSNKPAADSTPTGAATPSASSPASPSPTSPESQTTEATGTPSLEATGNATDDATTSSVELPDGYHQLGDPMGFSFAVPDGWTRVGVKNGTQVTYAGSAGLEHLQVGVIANAGYTSYDNFVTLEKTAKKKDTDYRRIKLEKNTFQGRAGAIWEYTYTDESGATVHAKDQGYVAANGTEYAIMIVGHDDAWQSGLVETFRVALDSWKLT